MDSSENTPKPADEFANGERQGWKADEIAKESSQADEDEIQRQIKRGNESEGDPNERDHAGVVNRKDTPQGREEAKNDTEGKLNDNG